MEHSVNDLLQFNESPDMPVGSSNNKSSYVSFIKINGKPILPPLLDEERRKELQKFKQKAIEIELKLAKKKKNLLKDEEISSEVLSIFNAPPNHESTPARPATLDLTEKKVEEMFYLSKSRTEGSFNKYTNNMALDCEILSSHKSAKNLDRAFRSTLEQRLASEDGIIIRNKLNKFQQSPITEEHFLDKFTDSDHDSRKGKKIWSPLQIDSINSLKIELPTKDSHEPDDDLEISVDESQITPETITQSPNLMRQNSYTLLTPSPALLQFLEDQKEQETILRSQSGRKTWDLSKAQKNWDPKNGIIGKSSDEECNKELDVEFINKRKSSSSDSLSAIQNNSINEPDHFEYSQPNSFAYDSGTSPESYNSKKSALKVTKAKCKVKGKKIRSKKSVPSPGTVDKVPFKDHSKSTQGSLHSFMNSRVNSGLSDISNLLLKMKVDFERQKRELEEKQQSEMKKLEIIFQKKEAELLSKVGQLSKKPTKSIYTQNTRESCPRNSKEPDSRMMGDGNLSCIDRKEVSVSEHNIAHGKRPHSAKDFHPELYSYENDCSRRARSMDFNQANQDTDLDFSFQEDFIQSKDTTLNNEYVLESDSISNFSSHSSTVSSDNRHDLARVCNLKKFQGISSEEYVKYNEAALKITAAARGFLTRRLFRTAHVQSLITTLRDAINCATQLHKASDIADSDIDLMRRLSRQIEAAWDAVYSVFFNTDTPTKLQLIATDRERLRAATSKASTSTVKSKRISSATRKSLDRKKGGSVMSKSQTSNGFSRVRTCTKMAASYPSPYFPQKLK